MKKGGKKEGKTLRLFDNLRAKYRVTPWRLLSAKLCSNDNILHLWLFFFLLVKGALNVTHARWFEPATCEWAELLRI